MSAEQIVRDILEQAIKDKLVLPSFEYGSDSDPQCRSAGELVGCAEILSGVIEVEPGDLHLIKEIEKRLDALENPFPRAGQYCSKCFVDNRAGGCTNSECPLRG